MRNRNFGSALDPVTTGLRVGEYAAIYGVEAYAVASQAAVSTAAAASAEAGAIAVETTTVAAEGAVGTTIGISTAALTAGIGIAFTVIILAYQLIMANQKKVAANRAARHLRWDQFYAMGVYLINDVYGPDADLDLGWSHAHNADEGFGEYYSLGAMYYWFTGGTERRSCLPDDSWDDCRIQCLNYIKSLGLDPTRIMGFENVMIEEEFDKTGFVSVPEKILTGKEALISLGYSADTINKVTNRETFAIMYDIFFIDLKDVSTEDEAKYTMNQIDIVLTSMGLDPVVFNNAINQQKQSVTGKTPSPIASSILSAGMPSWGWIIIAGIAVTALAGIKKGKKPRSK